MGSTIPFPGTSAEAIPLPAVIHTNYGSYTLPRNCTLHALDNGRWGCFVQEYSTGEYVLACVHDRRHEAELNMYQMVNRSDDLMVVDTCQQCWGVIKRGTRRIIRNQMSFCCDGCATKHGEPWSASMLRAGVMAAVFGTALSFWFGLYELSIHVYRYFGAR